ncbi:ThiF family adenylyltransferase [Methylobacterium sp. Leaf118]|uniref:ThiF family adenylyltransferase n=1 Tax=Methylobacterium sp. Leaf118 TaxID=2876562 RepID=UPI001E282F0A|nr:ThiF family adenylyltransferase [Methylobacterium sp. Leaf118]
MLDLVLLEAHAAELRSLLATPDGAEAAAYLLLGRAEIGSDPWSGRRRHRMVSHRAVPVPEEDKVSASGLHVTWSTRSFVRLLKAAEEQGLTLAIVHTHPGSHAFFSDQDDANERDLLRIVGNRSGAGHGFASVVLGGDGSVCARRWTAPATAEPCERVAVVGRGIRLHGLAGGDGDPLLDRQARLFGPTFNGLVRALKVGVVGCGGTGSPTALLLARLGIGHVLLVDDDVVELTNLNRVHGSRRTDVEGRVPKVEVLRREIEAAGLGVEVTTFKGWVGDAAARDALRSCDVVFGCTDDHDGRLFLNRLAYFYGIPVIDMGLRIMPARDGRPYEMAGRVTLAGPGAPCLMCRGLVDPRRAMEEALRRTDPAAYEARKAEAYVLGGGDPAPAVVTFTTETACMAVNELLQALTGFRGDGGMRTGRQRRFDAVEDRATTCTPRAGCEVCAGTGLWGRGDVLPFLYRAG